VAIFRRQSVDTSVATQYIHTLVRGCGCAEPSSYSSGYGQPAASHPGYQPPAHPVSQQYQTSTSQPASGSGKYPSGTIASPSAFSSFPAMSAGYPYQQSGSKPPGLTAEQYAGYIRPQSLPRHHTPQSGELEPAVHSSVSRLLLARCPVICVSVGACIPKDC